MMYEADKIDLKDVSASEMEQFIAPYGRNDIERPRSCDGCTRAGFTRLMK